MEKTKTEKFLDILKGWGCPILVALIVVGSFKSAIADWNTVPTGSMKPTILEGDRIFVNKLAYDLKVPFTTKHIAEWEEPQRGEIVVFYSPADSKRLVKRVVGLPGDTIALEDNKLFINGKAIEYKPIESPDINPTPGEGMGNSYCLKEDLRGVKHSVMIQPDTQSRCSFDPITIPPGHYFMMGDNRDNSADSRYFGFVKRDRIVGRAIDVVISLDINNKYRPRWERFFLRLP